jgi:hypothetical protein
MRARFLRRPAVGPYASTALGIFTGLVLFLAMAMIGVLATNETAEAEPPSLAPGPSAAAGASSPSLDLDGDGAISLAEAAGYREIVVRFERADRDRDGRLSRSEFARLEKLREPKPRPAQTRQQIRRDANASLAAQREER